MATTSSILTAGKASAGQGGNGKHGRRGLRASLAAGVVALGCAAALTLGGLRAGDSAQSQPAASSAQSGGYSQQFLAWNTQLPGEGTLNPVSADQQQFLAWNTQFPTGGALDWEQAERTQVAPAQPLILPVMPAPLSGERQQFLEWNGVILTTPIPAEGTQLSGENNRR